MNEYMNKFDTFCTDLFVKKLPALSESVKESLVKFAPFGAILLIVLALPLVLAGLGLSAVFAPFGFWSYGYRYAAGGVLGLIFSLVSLVLHGLAIAPLFARSIKGWNLLLYSMLITSLSSLLVMNLSTIVWLAIELYVLYQIKAKYK